MPLTIQQFRDQHDHLLLLVEQFQKVVDEDDLVVRAGEARSALMTLAAHLQAHLDAEDESLYADMQRSSDAVVRTTAELFKTEMGGLAQVFASYTAAWSEHAIRTDGDGFTVASRTILDALRHRIEKENATLYPLAGDMTVSVSCGKTGEPPHIGRPIVCIVDDNDCDFLLITEAWREIGSAITFEHYPMAEKFLVRITQPPVPDLVIVDMNLPILGGLDLVKQVRALSDFKQLPMVMCSSACSPRDNDAAHACGATGFFPKPATFAEYLPFVTTMNDLIAYHRNR